MAITIQKTEQITEPGAYDIEESLYYRDPCPHPSLSKSLATILLNATPLHAWHAHPKLNPDWKPETGSRRTALGSACHRMLLGAGPAITILDYGDYKKKAAREERDAAIEAGNIPLLATEADTATDIVKAAKRQLIVTDLESLALGQGSYEVTVSADLLGCWARCRLDWWGYDDVTVVDYKTTAGLASKSVFTRRCSQMDYDLQDAFYQKVVTTAFPDLAGRIKFIFVVQEIDPPWAVAMYEVSEADRTVATRKIEAAIATFSDCLERNEWPAYPTHVQRITLPTWHYKAWLDREAEESESGPDV